jgi:hypothetical protein
MAEQWYARFQHRNGAWFPGDATVNGQPCFVVSSFQHDIEMHVGETTPRISIVLNNASTAAALFANAVLTGELLPVVELEAVDMVAGRQWTFMKSRFLKAVIAQANRTGSMVGLLAGQERMVVYYEEMKVVYSTQPAPTPLRGVIRRP